MSRLALVAVVVLSVSWLWPAVALPCKLVFSPSPWNVRTTALPPNPTILYTDFGYRVTRVHDADGRELSFREGPLCVPKSWTDAPLDATATCDEARRDDLDRVLSIDVSRPGTIEIMFGRPGREPVTRSVTIDPDWRAPCAIPYEASAHRPGRVSLEVPFEHHARSAVTVTRGDDREVPMVIRPMGYAVEVFAGSGEPEGRPDERRVHLERYSPRFNDLSADGLVRVTPLWHTGTWGTPWEGHPDDLPDPDEIECD